MRQITPKSSGLWICRKDHSQGPVLSVPSCPLPARLLIVVKRRLLSQAVSLLAAVCSAPYLVTLPRFSGHHPSHGASCGLATLGSHLHIRLVRTAMTALSSRQWPVSTHPKLITGTAERGLVRKSALRISSETVTRVQHLSDTLVSSLPTWPGAGGGTGPLTGGSTLERSASVPLKVLVSYSPPIPLPQFLFLTTLLPGQQCTRTDRASRNCIGPSPLPLHPEVSLNVSHSWVSTLP